MYIKKRTDLIGFLSNIPIFNNLDKQEISKLADAFQTEIINKDHKIITEGDIGEVF